MIFSRFRWNDQTILELENPIKAFVYYRHHRMNLLSGFPETYPLEKFVQGLEEQSLQAKVPKPIVYHFYYEYGLIQQGLSHLVDPDAPLAIEIEYSKSLKRAPRKPKMSHLPLVAIERPSWSEYKEAFGKVQEHLLDGNCYQVNLTFPFDFMTEELLDPRDIADYFFFQKGLGAYSHCTYLGEELILSNSPECLFQYRDNKIVTMPIKGTIKRNDFKEAWSQLLADKKEEGELIMITDLLKNDLNRLDGPRAVVSKLRAPLKVPGLLHQYSLIELKLKNKVSFNKVMQGLFPGGSITGAPKKRVMEIIGDIERWSRGIYCGSTVLCIGTDKVASINIRTAQIQIENRIWRYGAGGGITLLSRSVDEFKEMESKVSSFLTLLKLRGY